MTKSKGITPILIYPMRVKKRIVFAEQKGRDAVPLPPVNRPLNDFEIAILKVLFKGYSKAIRRRVPKFQKGLFLDSHIDHKISIHSCFWNNVSIDDASHVSNLRIIEGTENCQKGTKDFIDEHNEWIERKYDIERRGIFLRLYDNGVYG